MGTERFEIKEIFSAASKYAIKAKGLKQNAIANSLEITPTTLNNYVLGKREGDEATRRRIAQEIGYRYEHFMAIGRCILRGDDPEKLNVIELHDTVSVSDELKIVMQRALPLISWVQAGLWMDVVDNFQPGEADEWLRSTVNVSENAFALRISGDSMIPEFLPGETIIVDPDVQPETGSYVVAKIDNGGTGENGEATFKQFIRDGNNIFLKPLNGKYPLMDMTGKEFRIVGCVVEKRKKY